jgi:hypothetical protein
VSNTDHLHFIVYIIYLYNCIYIYVYIYIIGYKRLPQRLQISPACDIISPKTIDKLKLHEQYDLKNHILTTYVCDDRMMKGRI